MTVVKYNGISQGLAYGVACSGIILFLPVLLVTAIIHTILFGKEA